MAASVYLASPGGPPTTSEQGGEEGVMNLVNPSSQGYLQREQVVGAGFHVRHVRHGGWDTQILGTCGRWYFGSIMGPIIYTVRRGPLKDQIYHRCKK